MVVHLQVNGEPREVTCRRDAPLLYLLRNDLDLKGTRFGCGLGQCGACMVLLDGHPTPSCDLPAWAAEDHDIRTVEGLADDPVMRALRHAFLERQAAQCGYCMSGVLVAGCALLRRTQDPARAEIAEALDRNLCRCGSHGRVFRAVRDAAESLRTGAEEPAAAGERPTEVGSPR